MSIVVSDCLRQISNWAFGNKAINDFLSSPLYLAVVITIIICLILVLCYPAEEGAKTCKLIRVFVYTFMTILVCVYLHDSVYKYKLQDTDQAKQQNQLMETIGQGESHADGVEVKPVIIASTDFQ